MLKIDLPSNSSNNSSGTKLSELIKLVGSRNVDNVLAVNSISRVPNIGEAFKNLCDKLISETGVVDYQKKISILNTLTGDFDIFEAVSLLDDDGWKLMVALGTMPSMLKIPETVTLPDSVNLLGNKEPVSQIIYDKAMNYLNRSKDVDPAIYNEYSGQKGTQIIDSYDISNPIQWFNLPWGKISLYSSLSDESKDFPVFPEELEDGVQANYETMPDLLYQYEPWQTYKGSGPRTNEFTFDMHRDMWSGNHLDGQCNELIRFCEANCYPEFKGAAVQTSIVTLYIAGKAYISGILTSVSVSWDGPLGQDDWYLHCRLKLSITEVSEQILNYTKVKERGLIK